MKYVFILVCALLMGMGWNPGTPDPEPEPPPAVEKPTKLLTNYYWGTSDEVVPGKAVLMPHRSLTGSILNASVNDERMNFEQVYGNGQEIWSASENAPYYGNANLTVETHDSIYKSIIQDAPTEPEPEPDPPQFGTRQEGYYHGQRNGDRATCYFYPIPTSHDVKLYFDGKYAMTIKYSWVRQDGNNGMLWKTTAEWNVRNNGPVGIGSYGVKHSSCYIEY